jgi:hypothetical protein
MRWTMRVIVALVVGASMTWALAWAATIWSPMQPNGIFADRSWPEAVPPNWDDEPWQVVEHRSVGLSLSLASSGNSEWMWCQDAGFPFSALRSSRLNTRRGFVPQLELPPWFPAADADGFRLPIWAPPLASTYRVLPVRPLWAGYALNTLLYTTVVLTAFLCSDGVRNAIRVRRGECGRCGYPLRGLGTCPECGGVGRSIGAKSA